MRSSDPLFELFFLLLDDIPFLLSADVNIQNFGVNITFGAFDRRLSDSHHHLGVLFDALNLVAHTLPFAVLKFVDYLLLQNPHLHILQRLAVVKLLLRIHQIFFISATQLLMLNVLGNIIIFCFAYFLGKGF